MHVQGVYETQMNTEVFSSISDMVESMATKSNAQVGGSAFAETKDTSSDSTINTESTYASLGINSNVSI